MKLSNGYGSVIKLQGKRRKLQKMTLPIIPNRTFLITNKYGNQYTRAVYHSSNWNTCMLKLGLNHAPHDCRYTFASLADNAGMNETCRKLIMGHALANRERTAIKTEGRKDVTMDVYTEKTIPELVVEINKLTTSFVQTTCILLVDHL